MKLVKSLVITASLSLLVFAGCSHSDGNNPGPGPIPDHLDFVPQGGQELTSQDFSEIQEFLKNNNTDSPIDFIIHSETQKEQDKVSKKYNKLSSKYKAALNKLSSKCTIIQPSTITQKDLDLNSSHPQTITLKSSSVDGDGCDLNYKSADRSLTDVIGFSLASKNYDEKKHLIGNESETILGSDLQQLLKYYTREIDSVTDSYAVFRNNEVTAAYVTTSLTIGGRTFDRTLSAITQMKILFKSNLTEIVLHTKVNGFSKELLVSAHGLTKVPGKLNFTYYVNGKRLDAQTIHQLHDLTPDKGDSDAQINDDGTVDTDAFTDFSKSEN